MMNYNRFSKPFFPSVSERLGALADLLELPEHHAPAALSFPSDARIFDVAGDAAPSLLDVKLAYDVRVRYRCVFRRAIADMRAWRGQVDAVIEKNRASRSARVRASNRQVALYLYADGTFLSRRLSDLYVIQRNAQQVAHQLNEAYMAELYPRKVG